jgi:hypothetical protein
MGGPLRQIKGYSHNIFTERKESSSTLKHKRAKGSLPKKKHHCLKRKNAYSRLQKLLLQKVRVNPMWK